MGEGEEKGGKEVEEEKGKAEKKEEGGRKVDDGGERKEGKERGEMVFFSFFLVKIIP